jgi:4'-phosphopantetheinyl transferase EntD
VGYCAAAVAWERDLRSLGIDAEVNRPLPEGVARRVCTDAERMWLAGLGPADGIDWPMLVFSAKESVYKAWYPLTRRWLGFLDAEITVDRSRRSFRARLLVPPPESLGPAFEAFEGRFATTREHVFTAVTVPG